MSEEQGGPRLDEITARKSIPDKLRDLFGKLRFRKGRMQAHPQQAPEGLNIPMPSGGQGLQETSQQQQEDENTSDALTVSLQKKSLHCMKKVLHNFKLFPMIIGRFIIRTDLRQERQP